MGEKPFYAAEHAQDLLDAARPEETLVVWEVEDCAHKYWALLDDAAKRVRYLIDSQYITGWHLGDGERTRLRAPHVHELAELGFKPAPAFTVGQHLTVEEYDLVPVGTRVSDVDDASWYWEKTEADGWVNTAANSMRHLSPQELSSYRDMAIKRLPGVGVKPKAEAEAGPTQEQLDELYELGRDTGYAQGKADGIAYVRGLLRGAGIDLAALDRYEAAAKAARLAYWEAIGNPRHSEPKEISIAGWAAALRVGAEALSQEA